MLGPEDQKKSLQGVISYLGIITDATPARSWCKQELEAPEKHCLDPTRIRNSDSADQTNPAKKDNVLENARALRAQINTRMSEITDILKSDPLCIPVTFQPNFQIVRKNDCQHLFFVTYCSCFLNNGIDL